MLPPEIRQGDFQQVCLSWHPEMLRSKTPPEETPGEALLEIQLKTQNETIAAVATPPGEGGIAVIRLSGSEAITVAQRLFRPQSKKKDEGNLRARTVYYGRFIDLGKGDMSGVVINGAVREKDGEVIDDGLLTLFPAPNCNLSTARAPSPLRCLCSAARRVHAARLPEWKARSSAGRGSRRHRAGANRVGTEAGETAVGRRAFESGNEMPRGAHRYSGGDRGNDRFQRGGRRTGIRAAATARQVCA